METGTYSLTYWDDEARTDRTTWFNTADERNAAAGQLAALDRADQ